MSAIPCYASGRAYRGLYSRFSGQPRPSDCRRDRVLTLTSTALGWPRLWQIADATLKRRGYSVGTRRLYRTVLRRLAAFAGGAPAQTTAATLRAFVHDVDHRHGSWAWTAMTISVLRTVFDKLGGRALCTGLHTPKRPQRLPDVLDRGTVRRVLAAAQTTRDQLLLGLLYGCGLKPGEVRRLRWGDVDVAQQRLRVRFGRGAAELVAAPRPAPAVREVALPPDLLPVLALGVARCPPGDYLFQGRRAGTALGTRRMEVILREAAAAAGLGAGVTCMVLRHTVAVHCLGVGAAPHALQEVLGHGSIHTTLAYCRCLLPAEVAPRQAGSVPDAVTTPAPDGAGEDTVQVPGVTEALFAEPVTVDAFDLPLRDPVTMTWRERTEAFYRMLKTHILGRFLGQYRASIRAG